MPCKCNTAKRDPDCTTPHPLNELLVDMAFPNLDREPLANPNPMNSRCGLEDCDCEYTIGGLLRRLELIMGNCTAGLHPAVDKDEWFRSISRSAKRTVEQTRAEPCPCDHIQAYECDTSCLCYVAGSEAERPPPGE